MLRCQMLPIALCLLGMCRMGSAQVRLEWKFPEGGQISVETTQTSEQKFVMGGQEMDSSERKTTIVASNVGNRDTAGKLRIASRIIILKTDMKLPFGAEIKYDSTKPQANEEAEAPFPEILKALQTTTKRTWTTVYDQANQVLAVEGAQAVLEAVDEETAALIRPQVDEQYMAQAAATKMARIPREPVESGAAWSLKETTRIEGGLAMTLNTQYKYVGTVEEDNVELHKITFQSNHVQMSMVGENPNGMKLLESELKIDESTGTLFFDPDKGQIVRLESRFKISGDMKLEVGGTQLPAKLELAVQTTTKLKEA
jgi:hypothetical protein